MKSDDSSLAFAGLSLVAGMLLAGSSPALALTTQDAVLCTGNGRGGTAIGSVICPVIRRSEVPAGELFGVWVDGVGVSGYQTTCTLYSYSYAGLLLGSASLVVSNGTAGNWDKMLSLPASQVPPYSAQTVYCALNSNQQYLQLIDIEPTQ